MTNLSSLAWQDTVECAKCRATDTGTKAQLRDRGWIVHEARPTEKPWTLVLCAECEPPRQLFGYVPTNP